MVEQQNDRIMERQKITPIPKRWNDGMTENRPKSQKMEWRKITRNPKRWKNRKLPAILKARMAECHTKSLKTAL